MPLKKDDHILRCLLCLLGLIFSALVWSTDSGDPGMYFLRPLARPNNYVELISPDDDFILGQQMRNAVIPDIFTSLHAKFSEDPVSFFGAAGPARVSSAGRAHDPLCGNQLSALPVGNNPTLSLGVFVQDKSCVSPDFKSFCQCLKAQNKQKDNVFGFKKVPKEQAREHIDALIKQNISSRMMSLENIYAEASILLGAAAHSKLALVNGLVDKNNSCLAGQRAKFSGAINCSEQSLELINNIISEDPRHRVRRKKMQEDYDHRVDDLRGAVAELNFQSRSGFGSRQWFRGQLGERQLVYQSFAHLTQGLDQVFAKYPAGTDMQFDENLLVLILADPFLGTLVRSHVGAAPGTAASSGEVDLAGVRAWLQSSLKTFFANGGLKAQTFIKYQIQELVAREQEYCRLVERSYKKLCADIQVAEHNVGALQALSNKAGMQKQLLVDYALAYQPTVVASARTAITERAQVVCAIENKDFKSYLAAEAWTDPVVALAMQVNVREGQKKSSPRDDNILQRFLDKTDSLWASIGSSLQGETGAAAEDPSTAYASEVSKVFQRGEKALQEEQLKPYFFRPVAPPDAGGNSSLANEKEQRGTVPKVFVPPPSMAKKNSPVGDFLPVPVDDDGQGRSPLAENLSQKKGGRDVATLQENYAKKQAELDALKQAHQPSSKSAGRDKVPAAETQNLLAQGPLQKIAKLEASQAGLKAEISHLQKQLAQQGNKQGAAANGVEQNLWQQNGGKNSARRLRAADAAEEVAGNVETPQISGPGGLNRRQKSPSGRKSLSGKKERPLGGNGRLVNNTPTHNGVVANISGPRQAALVLEQNYTSKQVSELSVNYENFDFSQLPAGQFRFVKKGLTYLAIYKDIKGKIFAYVVTEKSAGGDIALLLREAGKDMGKGPARAPAALPAPPKKTAPTRHFHLKEQIQQLLGK